MGFKVMADLDQAIIGGFNLAIAARQARENLALQQRQMQMAERKMQIEEMRLPAMLAEIEANAEYLMARTANMPELTRLQKLETEQKISELRRNKAKASILAEAKPRFFAALEQDSTEWLAAAGRGDPSPTAWPKVLEVFKKFPLLSRESDIASAWEEQRLTTQAMVNGIGKSEADVPSAIATAQQIVDMETEAAAARASGDIATANKLEKTARLATQFAPRGGRTLEEQTSLDIEKAYRVGRLSALSAQLQIYEMGFANLSKKEQAERQKVIDNLKAQIEEVKTLPESSPPSAMETPLSGKPGWADWDKYLDWLKNGMPPNVE